MAILVRPVDLHSERDQLVEVLQRNLPDLPHAARFDWLYLKNPAGTAWSWFAWDQASARPVGVASLFPRFMWIGKDVKACGQAGDFAVDTSHRSLGPATALQRATLEPVRSGALALCYDCPPDERGMATFRRLHMEINCEMHRYVRLLRVDRWLTARLGTRNALLGPLSLVGNFALSLRTGQPRSPTSLDIAPHFGSFGEEFSTLDQEVGGDEKVIRGRRRAEDLNWRYNEDPVHRYRVLTARRGGELKGFAIYSVTDHIARIADLFGLETQSVDLELVEAVVEELKSESVQSVDFLASDEREVSSLKKAHFRYRSRAERVVAYGAEGGEVRTFLNNRPRWTLGRGDVMA